MIKVLFICHGNICRSSMAEFVMKDLVEKAGLSGQFEIASAATSTEEIGNPVYPPAWRKLAEHGISCAGKTARQMTRRDYETYEALAADLEVIRCPVDINGFEYEIREASCCVKLGRTGSDRYTPQDSLALTRLMYDTRMSWGMKFAGEV